MNPSDKEQKLIDLKKTCDKYPHPYNAMIFGMWCEHLYGVKIKNPFDKENKLSFWWQQGWWASEDARKMISSTK